MLDLVRREGGGGELNNSYPFELLHFYHLDEGRSGFMWGYNLTAIILRDLRWEQNIIIQLCVSLACVLANIKFCMRHTYDRLFH